MIFFVIIILIGLTYYDLKYSIIFCIILYLIYLYFNKLTYESNYNEYKQFNEEIDNILRNIEVFRKYNNQSYKLGLKYYKTIFKNIILLNDNINNKLLFKSILEKTKIFLEIMIEKFNSIIFSIDDIEESKKLNDLIMDLNKQFNKIIKELIFIYNREIKEDLKCNNGMFCNDNLILNLYLNINDYIYNDNPELDHNMFDKGKYIGMEKGNEIDYDHGVGIEKKLRLMTMNK